jgi:Domain of unknown function (DU1801)
MGTPTWSHNGVLCICKPFKNMVKVTFLNGAQLDMDPLFNAELDGTQWRPIKFFEGDEVDTNGLKKLLLAAVAFNAANGKRQGEAGRSKGKVGQGSGKDTDGPPGRRIAPKPKHAAVRPAGGE